ncbi:MAG: hypothetical protein IPM39_29270 [Chloroflexi bacterium]|nr:hypothetical protein [Chloroflexota bacterium]
MSEYGRSPSASFDTSNPAPARSGWRNLAQYIAGRGIMSLLTVAAVVYIIIIVGNLGGYVDEIIEGRIENTLMAWQTAAG